MAETKVGIILEAQDRASRQIQEVSSSLEKMKGRFDQSVSASKQFAVGMTAAGVALGGLIGYGVKVAADLQTAKIGLTTLLGSAEQAGATVERIKKEAARTPFELVGLTQAVQLMTSVTHNGDKAIDIILNVGEGLAAMGKGQAELDRIIVNLQQVAAVGHASMVDIKQFAFAGIPIFEMLQQQTGLAGDALGDFISEGGVTFEALTTMFDKANDSGGRFFNAYKNQAGSFNQALSNLKDSFGIFLATTVETTGIFDMLTKAISKATEFIDAHKDSVANAVKWLSEHKIVIYIVAGAIMGALVPAIYAAAVAFGTLMITLAPFMLAGAAIAGIVAGIFWIVENWDMLSAKAAEIWGGIKDTVAGIVGAIVDTVQGWLTKLSEAWQFTWLFLKEFTFNLIGLWLGSIITLLDFFFPDWQAKLQAIADMAIAIFNFLKDGVIAVWDTVVNYVSDQMLKLWGFLQPILVSIRDFWVAVWSAVRDVFVMAFTAVRETAEVVINWITEKIDWLAQKVGQLMQPITELANKAKQAFGAIGSSVVSGFNSVINTGRSAIGLAEGGVVTRPTFAMIGEGGEPEAVIPLSKLAGIGGGGITINIMGGNYLSEDAGRMLGDQIIEVLRRNMKI